MGLSFATINLIIFARLIMGMWLDGRNIDWMLSSDAGGNLFEGWQLYWLIEVRIIWNYVMHVTINWGWGVNANNNTEPMGPNSTVPGNRYIEEAGGSMPSMIQSNIRLPFDRGINFFTTINLGGLGRRQMQQLCTSIRGRWQ